MLLRRCKILFVLFVCTSSAFAQLQVKNFFSLTGKKNIPVNVIVQDGTGFLWLGTVDGLYKFDGNSSTSISKEHPVLKQEITALFIDEKQTTWIGTKTGKVYFITKNKLDSLVFPEKTQPEKITSICQLNAYLFIGTYGTGIYCYTKKGLAHYTVENGLSDDVIYKITCNKKNTVWCGTDGGITEINLTGETPEFKIISDKTGLPDNIVRNIAIDEDRLMISMQDSGVCYYNLKNNQIEKNSFFMNWTMEAVLNSTTNNEKKMVVATEKKGLFIFENGGVSIYNYDNYIQCANINQLFVDREKQLWIASKNGISQFIERRYNFINAARGLDDGNVLALAMDNDNSLWLGSTKGISKIVTDVEGKLLVTRIQELKKYTISCATKAPDGTIWFGTYGNGIIILSSENKNNIILDGKDDMMANGNISNIFFPDKNTVFVSTLGGGLIKGRINLSEKKKIEIEKTYTEKEGLGSNYVYTALTDNNSKLYVGTDGGGLQVLENGKFIDLTKKFKLASSTVFSLCKDKYNTIWATSNADGIIKFDGKSLMSINSSSGLRDEQPQQMIASGNTIFAVNSKGIDKINCKDNSITYYDLFDGDLEPNLNAIFFNGDKIYSGTNNGILVYRTSQEKTDSIKPTVFISSFLLNFKQFPLDSIYEFKYNQNNIELGFEGIWLKNPGKLIYRYKLHGLEEQWIYTNKSETVNYNNLNPGNYTFMVQVKNEEDLWSDPTGYSFIILTPIWKRWWFWALVLTTGALSVYSLVKYRLRALQRENLLLERRVKERTSQIEKQSKIIERKNIELEQLSLVASKTDNVVLILDANGKLEYINESFVKLNKMTIDQLTKTYGETIYELSNNPNITEIVNEAVKNKRSVNYESLNKKVISDTEIWESSTLTPLFDEDGTLKKIIIIDTDVSERKKQEQIITQKNKDITDSISYARKIQHAILPNDGLIKSHLPHSFVLYMTKDIVSGDFYWFSHLDGFSIIAAVDCTGHGVPGAFMSLIGYNLLNKIVNEEKITDPKEILFQLNRGVLDALHKNESESKDGMDIAICKINHKENTLEYGGAMRPLWIINSGVLTEIKADKIPIGTKQTDRNEVIVYTTHTVSINKGDSFYIFTDGYADQFGGANDKKYSTGKFKELLLNNSKLDFFSQERNVKSEHLKWKGGNEQVDDILLIGFGF